MSRVTNVVIMISELEEIEDEFLEHLQVFTCDTMHGPVPWFKFDPCDHFGGDKCGEVAIFTAAINYCGVNDLCAHLNSFKKLIWRNSAAAMIETEGEGLQIWRYGDTTPSFRRVT